MACSTNNIDKQNECECCNDRLLAESNSREMFMNLLEQTNRCSSISSEAFVYH